MDRASLNHYQQIFEYDLQNKVLPFWIEKGTDAQYGGINTCLDRKGNVYSTEKSVWMQGRGGWMFANICNTFGMDERYREFAENAIKFIKNHCIDPTDERLYFIVGADGAPIRKRRYVFSEYFYAMANAEYYGLTHEEEYLREARKYHAMVTAIWEDPRNDPFKITPKYLPTATPMHGLANDLVLMLVTRTLRVNDPENRDHYMQLERRILKGILELSYNKKLGILLENVGPKGEYIGNLSSGRIINPGHCLEGVWYMLQEAEELQETLILESIEKIYHSAFRYGWDHKHGGLLYFIDAEGFPPQAYEHDMKLWWVHAEAIISSIKLYRITRNEEYWMNFMKLTDYSFDHFRDEEYGEWYGYLRRDGKPTEPPCKGNVFKGPFHVPRMYCEVIKELNYLKS